MDNVVIGGGDRVGRRLVAAAVVCVALGWASSGLAQSGAAGSVPRSIALDRYRPSPIQRTGLLGVETSAFLEPGTTAVGVSVDGADDTLEVVRRRGGENRQVVELVDRRFEADLGLGVGLYERLDLGVALPVVYQDGFALLDSRGGTGELANWAFGDLRVVPRYQLRKPGGLGSVGIALSTHVSGPVGDRQSYNSAGAFTVEPRLAVDWRPLQGTLVAANLGWEVRPRRVVLDRLWDDVLTWGLGVEFPTGVWRVDGVANLLTEAPTAGIDPSGAVGRVYAEALGGIRAELSDRVTMQLAAGSGLTSAVGAPETRVVVSVDYAAVALDADDDSVANREDACPHRAEDLDGFRDADGCPDPDNDGDGVLDEADACPMEPEDPDGYEDADGCPDPDNDGDGIADAEDACPMEKGIEKKQGCPFVDSDGDGIDDAFDANPNAAEDVDGYQDEDGVPDPDNDGDGIPDEVDDCPMKPETINGIEDEDGCPDEGESSVEVTDEKIEIDERVYFDTDRATIKQRSYRVLEEVAAALKAHPEIKRVRIEGHTDSKGSELYNLALSQRRARSVREFLIEQGVDGGRLESKGYGEGEPVASNETEEGRRKNRRVEMTVLEVEN